MPLSQKGWRKRGAAGEPFREGGERKRHPKNIWLSQRLMRSLWLRICCGRLAGVGNLSHEEVSGRGHNLPSPDRGKQRPRQGAVKSLLGAQKKTAEPPAEGSSRDLGRRCVERRALPAASPRQPNAARIGSQHLRAAHAGHVQLASDTFLCLGTTRLLCASWPGSCRSRCPRGETGSGRLLSPPGRLFRVSAPVLRHGRVER